MAKAVAAALLLGCAVGYRTRSHRTAGCGQKGPSSLSQISGGADATAGEWRWQVGLVRPDSVSEVGWNFVKCGGILIEAEWVLTSAQCVDRYQHLAVMAGETTPWEKSDTRQYRTAAKVIVHPNYSADFFDIPSIYYWDLALIRVDRPFEMDDFVGTICLPGKHGEAEDVVGGERCWITGWGHGYPIAETLQEAEVNIISRDDCAETYSQFDRPRYNSSNIDESMICARGRNKWWLLTYTNACGTTDYGGPLMCQGTSGTWSLYGVSSWGANCGRYPSVYASVHAAMAWIEDTLEDNRGPSPTPLMCPSFTREAWPGDRSHCECPLPKVCTLWGNTTDCPRFDCRYSLKTSAKPGRWECTWQDPPGYWKDEFHASCKDCKCVDKASLEN